jgi:hypothetical protein
MMQSTYALKTAALLLIAVAVSASDAVSPKEALKDVEMASSYRIDEQSHGRDLGFFDFGWNFNMLMFNVGWCGCEEVLEGPLKHVCNDMCNPPLGPGPPAHVLEKCNCCVKKDDSGNCCTSLDKYGNCVYTSDEAYTADDGSSNGGSQSSGENKSVGGASAHTNWWLYVVGAATVALVGAGIVMRKRRNAEAVDGLDGEASLSGAVSRRASLLAAGAAPGVAAGAAMPAFLNVPSFRKAPSGLEVGLDGTIVEPSGSNYMDMDNHVDPSQLPEGVEVSPSGNLEPYHSGSMA